MKPHRGKRTNRAGYALVLFLMMVFGLMGLAALVIDLGFARLAQRQMQTAVDSAALEGLRWRDVLPDQQRRQKASDMVANVFDDDLDPTNGDTGQYGAGPVVDFTGGVGPPELAASQTMSPGVPPVYKPKRADGTPGLELNSDNTQQNGDMVAGTYGNNLAYDQQSPVPLADENANYDRRDFTPSADTTTSVSAPAFLVRMRRTPLWNVSGSLDNQPGVSSSDPTLPFLFGRGTTIYQQAGAAYSPRQDGIEVRATAIAAAGTVTGLGLTEAGRVKAVGPPYQGTDANNNPVNIPGITPFAVTQDYWESGSWGQSPSANRVDLAVVNGGTVGMVITPGVVVIGDQIMPAPDNSPFIAPPVARSLYCYVPIYNKQIGIVIGFGNVQWDTNGVLTKTSTSSSPVARGNASGVLVRLPQDATGKFSVDLSQVFAWHAQLGDPSHILYAPVLVNRFIGPQRSNP